MKASILFSIVLISGLLLGTAHPASAHRHWHRYMPVHVAGGCAPVVYERPVVTYVHGRCYHPTPYCSEPVVFRREYSEGPWYYVGHRPEHRGHYVEERRGGYCHGGHCRR